MYTTAFATSYHGVWLANSNSSQRSVPFCNRQQRCTVAKQRTVMMGLRAVENFDGSFVLDPTVREKLEACLKGTVPNSSFTASLFFACSSAPCQGLQARSAREVTRDFGDLRKQSLMYLDQKLLCFC